MLALVLIIIAVLVAGMLVLVATRPDTFTVQRAALINAPPATVFEQINDFERWQVWSPWEKKDPAMQRRLGATTAGTGASYAWEGNKNVGKGSMTITDSQPPSRIEVRLDFLQPFEAHNTVTFTLEPRDGATQLTWTMHGPVPFFGKALHLFINMDRMVGNDFEAGLASLKVLAES